MAKLSGGSSGSKGSGGSKSPSYSLPGKNTGVSLPSKGGSSSSSRPSSSSSYRPNSSNSSSGSSGVKLSGGSSSSRPGTSGSGGKLSGSSSGSSGSRYTGRGSSGTSSGLRVPNASGGKLNLPGSKSTGASTVKSGVLGAYTNKPSSEAKKSGSSEKKGGVTVQSHGKTYTYDDELQSKIPRRENKNNFQAKYTPNGGNIKSNHGGKLIDGIVYYPDGVKVDFGMAARTQAFMDYNNYDDYKGLDGQQRSVNAKDIYGDYYDNELQRLASIKVGQGAWERDGNGNLLGGPGYVNPYANSAGTGGGMSGGYTRNTGVLGAYTDVPNHLGSYEDALRASEEAAADALRRQTQMAVDDVNAQKDPLRRQFEDAAQQAFIAQKQGEKNLPQMLSAQGLTGGATESANLALLTGYQNGINDITGSYNDNLASIDRDAARARSTGDISIAQNSAQYGQMFASAILQAQQRAAEIQAQRELAEYNARQDSERQKAQWERDDLLGKQNAQMDYDYWVKKQDYANAQKAASSAARSARSTENQEIDPRYLSTVQPMLRLTGSGLREESWEDSVAGLADFSTVNTGGGQGVPSQAYQPHGMRDILDLYQGGREDAFANSPFRGMDKNTFDISTSEQLSDFEKKRRLAANQVYYNR